MHLILTVLVAAYFLLALLLFMGWHSAWKRHVVTLLDSGWGWWVAFGIFWKLGRTRATTGDWWPLWFGGPALIVYRAGQQWTAEHGQHLVRRGDSPGS